MEQELHPFAKYIAILARGKTKVRALTLEESEDAMGIILRGEAEPEQVGAFLMLLRLKEEEPQEIAGFTLAARSVFKLPSFIPKVDVDWSSYAGKRIQLPWFLLSALALSQSGSKVFMHGTGGHTPGRVYTRETLQRLGLPIAKSLEEAASHIEQSSFSYTPLEVLSPILRHLIELRPLLGLRSPVHSFSRMLNPFNAPTMLQGIFHRGFMDIHAGAAMLLKQPRMAVFRGEGGEIERRPNKPTLVYATQDNSDSIPEKWPVLVSDPRQAPDEEMNVGGLLDLWHGRVEDEYATTSVTGTLAIAVKTMGKADSIQSAQDLAERIWKNRNASALPEQPLAIAD